FPTHSQQPTKHPSDAQRATALISKGDGTIKIINTTNQAVNDAKLWINGSFVTHVDTVPAKGLVTIKRENLYNRDGISLAKANIGIQKVQLEMADKLYNLEGPAFEQ